MPIDIYITSFFRKEFTEKTINLIHERTAPGTFSLHVYDNNSDRETRDFLYGLLERGKITSLMLDSRNTGCLYNKLVFHAMTESSSEYCVITDNDVYPPKLSPDWLSQMIALMDKHTEIALLAPQLPPQWLQMPLETLEDVVYAKAVGNTFKICRRAAVESIIHKIDQKLGAYGDDGAVSELLRFNGWRVAFCRNIFCFHAGQCENWGYKQEEIAADPRKAGYGKPFTYTLANKETYEPTREFRI